MKFKPVFWRPVRIFLFQMLSFVLAVLFAGCNTTDDSLLNGSSVEDASALSTTQTAEESGKEAKFSMTLLDVGQGLSVLVQADGAYLLYDGGGRSTSSYVVSYLQQHEITQLQWIVASHYDEDHISGLVGVLKTAEVEQAMLPDYTTDTRIFQSLKDAIEEQKVPVVYPSQGEVYNLGHAEIEVVGPGSNFYEKENNNSLCLRISYGSFRCLLTGDAEQEAEQDMVQSGQELSCDVYVVGHHGSASSSGKALLDAASPQYAFLSVGAENPYGHPAAQTLNALRQRGIALYRTDKQGEVSVYSDGERCWFSTEPCEDWSSGTQTIQERVITTTSPQEAVFVLNTHTKKFHLPDCPSAAQIEERNRAYTAVSREELLARGYTACKRCAA